MSYGLQVELIDGFPEWQRPLPEPPLKAREVHVWRGHAVRDDARRAQLETLLSVDERERAAAMTSDAVRASFVTARAILRRQLGRELELAPSAVELGIDKRGKPFLVDNAAPTEELSFSISHSADVVLVAVSRGCRVGVDIERIRTLSDADALARRYFSPAEVAMLAATPAEDRRLAFFRCWARKEAYAKGKGLGLQVGFDTFDVSFDARAARLLETRAEPSDAERWMLAALDPGPGFVGALAIEAAARGASLRLLDASE